MKQFVIVGRESKTFLDRHPKLYEQIFSHNSSTILDFTRIFGGRRKFEALLAIAFFYTALSLLYSFVGLLHYQPGSHFHEYVLTRFAIEVGGHFLFGFVAALPLMEFGIAMLTGSLAVLIDIDHLLSALNFDVTGRPDHSILYMILSALFVLYLARRLHLAQGFTTKLAFVAPISLFAHFSYDVFASSGTVFQPLIPFSFQAYYFPYYSWAIFEAAALILAGLGLYLSRMRKNPVNEIVPQAKQLKR